MLATDELQQLIISKVLGQQIGISHDDEMLACTRHRHIEFTVHDAPVKVLKNIRCEEVQLVVFLNGEAIDDVVALGTLEALHGIDGDALKGFDAVFFDGAPDGGYLVTVRHDYAHGLLRIKVCGGHLVDLDHRGGNYVSLVLVYFVGG